MKAIGAYFDTLVDLRGLKFKAVTKAAGVSDNYIGRLRSGDIGEPSASILVALTEAVSGSWDDIKALLDDDATPELAVVLAEAWYKRFRRMSNDEKALMKKRLLDAVRPFLDDPSRIDALLGH